MKKHLLLLAALATCMGSIEAALDVTVKEVVGPFHHYEMHDRARVSNLKEKVAKDLGLRTETVHLLYEGNELPDNTRLSELDLEYGTIYVVQKLSTR